MSVKHNDSFFDDNKKHFKNFILSELNKKAEPKIIETDEQVICRSPFRPDNSPSFSINLETGLWNDFGLPDDEDFEKEHGYKNNKGNIVTFIYNKLGKKDYLEAVKYFCAATGVEVPKNTSLDKESQTKQAIMQAAYNFYRKNLFDENYKFECPDKVYRSAIGYQRDVRKHSDQVLRDNYVGFATKSGGLVYYLRSLGYKNEQMTSTGLVKTRANKPNDVFFGDVFVYFSVDENGVFGDVTAKDPKGEYNIQLKKNYKEKGVLFYGQHTIN